GKRQHQLQQEKSEPKINLTRRLVRTVDDDLQEVQDQQHVHRLRRIVMQTAQQPAAQHFILDVINAFPGGVGTRAVGHPEENSGYELNGQRENQRAAPDIAPARTPRDIFVQRSIKNLPIARALVKPVGNAFHTTGIFSLWPARYFWNLTHTSAPLRISTSNESSPRLLGLPLSLML